MKRILQIFIFFVLPCLASSVFAETSNFTVLEKSTESITVEWEAPELLWNSHLVMDKIYVTPQLGTLALSQEPGSPQTPVDAWSVQANGGMTVVVLDSIYEESSSERIMPAPTSMIDAGESTRFYTENSVYQTPAFYPSSFVETTSAKFRSRDYYRIQINPLKYNPVSGRVRLLRYLKLSLKSTGGAAAGSLANAAIDKPLARTPRLGRVEAGSPGLLKPSRTMDAAEPRVKLTFVDEGVYGVSGEQLQNAGMSLAGLDPQKIRLEHRGVEQPCTIIDGEDGSFDAADKILFWGQRLSGENDFYHAYTDSNVYWIFQGAQDGLRFTPAEPEEASEFVYSFPHLQHFEQDLEYYQGDTNTEIQETETVSGEGWVWQRAIDPGETYRINFDLPGLVMEQDSVGFSFRVRGVTRDSDPDAHFLRLSINGEIIYEKLFDDREELMPVLNVPAAALQDSSNELAVESVRQGDRASRFYFDWFKISYQRELVAVNGQLHIDSTSAVEPRIHWVGGFPSESVRIWNLAEQSTVAAVSINTSWAADLRVESAAITDGNYAHFYLENDLLYSGSRGTSVVVLDSQDGRLLFKKSFDTFASAEQSDSMAVFLNALPNGVLVMAGIRDDGANSLTNAAVQAFLALGSSEIDKLQYRQSWAFLAQKGAGVASAEQRTERGGGPASALVNFIFEDSDGGYGVQFVAQAPDDIVVFDETQVLSPLKIESRHTNPISNIIGADYLIISHKKFLSEAQRLADYRRQFNGFETAVVDVADVFDAFSDGIFDPNAIQKLMLFTSRYWMPGPSFLLLFGDATWDMKQRYPTTQFSNFVPSLGNPVSDALLACLDGEDDYLPDVSVGRIPATTMEDARAIVDKTIEYESTPSAAWKKNFLFISGGLDEDEQELFLKQSQSLAMEFVDVAPSFGRPIYISKEAEENQADERSLILDRINDGALWTNFIGHAASRTWELMFNNPDIEDLSNQERYTVVSSMTCHTGRFAEPNQESFGERFLLIPDKGAVGFWGTSGWGYSYEDYIYLQQLYPTVLADTVRYLGDIVTLTKFRLWQNFGLGAHFKNLILQYNLMGDPALTLSLPTKPDLTITADDVTVSPAVPSEADSTAQIHVRVQNWGLAAHDSTRIRLDIEHAASSASLQADLTLPPAARIDSSTYTWPLHNMAGTVDVTAVVDPQNNIDEWDESNNEHAVQVTVLTSHLELVSPPQNSILPLSRATLKVQAPQQYFDENLRYIFQIDTSKTFDSPLLQTSQDVRAHPLVIKWQPQNLAPHQRYFWRVYPVDGESDSSFLAAFTTTDSDSFGWKQSGGDVAENNEFINTAWTKAGARLDTNKVHILIQSAWTNSVGYSVIDINNQSALPTSRGYNFAVLDQTTGSIIETAHFDTYADQAAVGNMIDFIAAIPNGRHVLAAVSDEGYTRMTDDAFTAIESIGSAKIREIKYRSMWAIIGKKGAQPGTVQEGIAPFQADGSVVLKDTLSVFYKNGVIYSERIGPATSWGRAQLFFELPDSCSLTTTVYGRRSINGDTVRLVSDVAGTLIDLSTIDASEFPFLTLAGNFSTQNGVASPTLSSWQVAFESSPDIALSPQLFTQSADTVLVGQEVTFYLDMYNIGLHAAETVDLIFEEGAKANGRTVLKEMTVDSIASDRFAPVQYTWQSGAIPGLKTIFITADQQQRIAELSEANNSISTTVYVHADTLEPSISLTFDERIIYDGDLVSPTPLIVARVFDNNPIPLSDTTSINVYLDGSRVAFSQADGILSLHPSDESDVRGVIIFQPQLDDGDHNLIIEFDDMSHNSAVERIRFQVESDLAIRNVLNYPNPFAEHTEFRFSLSQQADIQVKIYTIAGRLIQTLHAGTFSVGYNKIKWDGRDESGDAPANGVYVYRVTARTDSESVAVISKLIVMR